MPASELEDLQLVVTEAICKAEFWLPASELDIKLHNLLHMVQKISCTGPVCWTAMWVYESMWGGFVKQARKKDSPCTTTLRRLEEQEAMFLHSIGQPISFLDPPFKVSEMRHEENFWCPRSSYHKHVDNSLRIKASLDDRKKKPVMLKPEELQGVHNLHLAIDKRYNESWESFLQSKHPRLLQPDGRVSVTDAQVKVGNTCLRVSA